MTRKIFASCIILAALLLPALLYAQQPAAQAPSAIAPPASDLSPVGSRGQMPQITVQPLPGPASGQAVMGQPITPQQMDAYRRLAPGQQEAIQSELGKTGGRLTPEAIEAMKARPDFKGLSPEDVAKGKQLLEQKEKGAESKESEKKTPFETEKKVITTEETKDKSLFDRFRNIGKYQDISLILRPFGYEFFGQAAVRVQTDRKDIPVPMKYVIGPGDEVKLLFWGRVNAQFNLTVDRDGKITIPQIGPMFVAGMTFEEMSKQVIKQSEQIVGTNVDISMGSLKTIQVFILGDVRQPGSYTIGSFATITDALLMSGGPTEIGSMRNVQLKRKGQLITTFDLYDLLLKGDKSKDMTLMAGDVVFVPVTGSLVGIAGNVKRPAVYELRGRFDLENLIALAGGIIPTAYTQQLQVERIIRNERQVIVDINDKNLDRAAQVVLQDADLVKVFSIVDMNVNAVYLNGNVKRPGKYEIRTGMKLGDLLKGPDDLLPETYFDYALIKRLKPPGMDTVLIPFNLGNLLLKKDASANIELVVQDQVFVFNRSFFKDKPFFTVDGEVRHAGRFDFAENFRVKDAILAAGDLTKDAYLNQAEIVRLNPKKKEYHTIYFNVARALSGEESDNFFLQDEDRIVIHSIWEQVYKKNVVLDGEVAKPGSYQFTEGMTVRDLVFKGGNILESAYVDEAEISSISTEGRMASKTERKVISLRKALDGDRENNLFLKPNDHLFVKRIPNWGSMKFVTVSGEFKFPGRYAIRKGEKLASLIERAGGYTDNAYLRGAVFKRETVREMQQRNLDEMAQRLQRELLSSASASVAASLSSEEVQAKRAEAEMKQRLIEYMKSLRATGRMTIAVTNLRMLKGSAYDIELEEGDSLHLPQKNSVVNIIGAVMSEGSHIYNENWGYEDYIGVAGGYSRYADASNAFVVKVDGSARKLNKGFADWSERRDRWELAAYGEEVRQIEPGDVIVVPEKINEIAWLREIRDITQILMNSAVVAATVIKLF